MRNGGTVQWDDKRTQDPSRVPSKRDLSNEMRIILIIIRRIIEKKGNIYNMHLYLKDESEEITTIVI